MCTSTSQRKQLSVVIQKGDKTYIHGNQNQNEILLHKFQWEKF